ncbi:response regulator transcription factor [Ruminococcus sp.]|uniref:response regulator n=1 Tax=Ruminococcus sp. TaxID=41978 RepID=UPI0025E447B4|nr:response regulator transcription factor [Ruminococcus sp.]
MNIVMIDDDKLVAMSLKTILESTGKITVLASGNSGEEAIALYDQHSPDCILMDIRMKGMSGLEAGEIILDKHPDAKILYLTTFSDDEYIIKAVLMGAKGYILKQDFESIAPALETVMKGQTVFGSEVANKLPELIQNKGSFDFSRFDIGEKEQEIITLVSKGLSNKEISQMLYLSEGTVRNYISTILEKLSLRDRTQLAVFYYTNIDRNSTV